MVKEAITEYPVNELIRKRWSARSFSEKEISEVEINTLLESASWAFSAMNYQPWRYIYVSKKDNENFDKFIDCLSEGNKPWAKSASLIMLSLAKKKYNDGSMNPSALHDVGAANATMILQATSMDIYGHLLGGFSKSKVRELFNIDFEEYEPVVFIVFGYLDKPDKLVEPYKTRETTPRVRNKIDSFAQIYNNLILTEKEL